MAELAYVRDGSINDVAQHFVVPVPSHIQELCFVWVNADSKAVCWISLGAVTNMTLNINIFLAFFRLNTPFLQRIIVCNQSTMFP